MINLVINNKKNILSSLLSLLLVGCIDTSSSFKPYSQQPINYDNTKYISSSTEQYLSPTQEKTTKSSYALADLIDLGQQNNPDTRIAWELAKKSATDIGMIESTYLPIITATALAGYQHGKIDLPKNPIIDDIKTSNSAFIPALTFRWLIFDFGKRGALVDAAKHTSLATNLNFNLMHQKIIHDVSVAYFSYGAAQKKVSITRNALQRSKDILYAVEQKRAKGLATVLDVALAKQQVAQVELQNVLAKGHEKDQYQILLSAIGASPFEKITVNYADDNLLPDDISPLTHDVIKKALAQRPDVLAQYELQQAAIKAADSVKSDYFPKVYLAGALAGGTGSFDVQGLPDISQRTSSSNILIGVSIPLYEGGMRQSRMVNAQSEIRLAQENLRKSQDMAIKEISISENTLKSALEANKASKNLVETTQLTYTASVEFYHNGLGTVTDINTAEIALLNAQMSQIDAYTGSQIAAVDLAFALGEIDKALPNSVSR
ncbi:TolC family protein [Proteus vulgaris]|jgi:outer membrane protein TolC|uniref:TolC family protein n=1 Tax=Proteus vulgaris TaxID=585 RepID=UPI000C9FB96B|nr:TolC family protein [Proteus vulgaris]MCH4254652.1 TolC family protein [Proteus vulgaris]UBH63539.1 TolC family protein [Proteus vulgaris]UWT98702.1 TolC family protein [Proteus vulgaris]